MAGTPLVHAKSLCKRPRAFSSTARLRPVFQNETSPRLRLRKATQSRSNSRSISSMLAEPATVILSPSVRSFRGSPPDRSHLVSSEGSVPFRRRAMFSSLMFPSSLVSGDLVQRRVNDPRATPQRAHKGSKAIRASLIWPVSSSNFEARSAGPTLVESAGASAP